MSSDDLGRVAPSLVPASSGEDGGGGGGGELAQSPSLAEVQAAGQHPSPLAHAVIGAVTHWALHAAALPVRCAGLQTSTLGPHEVGQLPSQISPASTIPLPHFGPQFELHPS